MKKIFVYSVLFCTFISIYACKKSFLEIQPEQNINQDNAITNLASTRSAVMGLYSFMQNSNYYGRTLLLIPDLMTDNVVQSRQAGTRYTNYERRVVNSSDAYAEAFWENAYKLIINANAIITKAPTIQVPSKDSLEMRQLIGEAYTLRAFAYLDLARFFCQPWNATTDSSHLGVPIVLQPYPSNVNTINYPERGTIAQTYNRIITDLNTALTFLPSNNEVYFNGSINTDWFKVRVNRLSTYAILARAELYKENWLGAETAASIVIGSGRYGLFNPLTIVNDYRTPQNIESIFELANNSFDNAGTESIAYIFNQVGYGEMLGTQNLYTSYNSTDVRRAFMTIGNRNAAGAETNVPLINKYNNISNYQENIKLLRIAELYLIRCEARAKLVGGNFSGSQADLQVIISARNSSTLTVVSTNTTPTSVITRMLSERRRELAFEGHRLFDLTRNKLGFTKFRSDGTSVSVSATSFRNILPIPISEIRANPKLLPNPGY